MRPSALEVVAGTFAAVIGPPLSKFEHAAPPLSRFETIALTTVSDLGCNPDALRGLSPEDRAEIRAEILREGGVDISAAANRHLPPEVPQ